ncbi:MAG TPA: type I restriction-modification system subunit M N-terminal domain-containing protein, partial [Saprospiraceae bacterium]|nr:type I restriction-modification system subunit M N-terminal domain-containing protein [Saprospiraceae bacterium]
MSSTIVQKIWNFCNTLRDDGVSYGDYLEQLTYLLFLKMADEYSKPPHKRTDINIPTEMNWESLITKSGSELEDHYNSILKSL